MTDPAGGLSPENSQRLRNLGARLTLAFTLLAVLPAAFLGLIAYLYSSGAVLDRQIANLNVLADIQHTEVRRWVDGLHQDLLSELQNEETRQALETFLQAEAGSPEYETAYARLSSQFQYTIATRQDFSHFLVLDRRGQVLLSSDLSRQGETLSEEDFFQHGLAGPYIRPPQYSPDRQEIRVMVSSPIFDQQSEVAGVIAATVNLDSLNRILAGAIPADSGIESYLVNSDAQLVTPIRAPEFPTGATLVESRGALAALAGQRSGEEAYQNYAGAPVFGVYRRLPELDSALLVEQDEAAVLSAVERLPWLAAGAGLLAFLIALIAAAGFTGKFRKPLAELTTAAEKITAGDLSYRAEVMEMDEIGELARAFNAMGEWINGRIAGLQRQVATHQQEIRATEATLAAAVRVSEQLSRLEQRTADPETGRPQPLDRVQQWAVQLVASQMEVDYAALYWTEPDGKTLALTNTYHQQDLPGQISRLPKRITFQEAEALPPLAQARSQMNLVLGSQSTAEAAAGYRGVLHLQSRSPVTFAGAAQPAFLLIASRLAGFFESVERAAEIYAARQELEQVQGRFTQESWLELLRQRQGYPAYRYRAGEITPVSDLRPEVAEAWSKGRTVQRRLDAAGKGAQSGLAVPIQLRDQVIGVLNLRFAQAVADPETVALAEEAAARLALVLENVRLIEAARQHVAREQMIGQATGRMREALDVDLVLQAALREIGQLLGLEEAVVQLSAGIASPGQNGA